MNFIVILFGLLAVIFKLEFVDSANEGLVGTFAIQFCQNVTESCPYLSGPKAWPAKDQSTPVNVTVQFVVSSFIGIDDMQQV